MQRFSEALEAFEIALAGAPRHPYALSAAANASLNLCDWPKVKQFGEEIARAVGEHTAVIAPFTLLGYSEDAALYLKCAKAWLANKGVQPRPWCARGALRERLSCNRAHMPFFDSRRHAPMMEAAFRQMWRAAQAGAAPKGFALTLEAVP